MKPGGTPDFCVLLREGAQVSYLGTEYRVSCRDAGTLLVLPSGKLVVGDPLTLRPDVVPLGVSLDPGRYRVVYSALQDIEEPRAHDVAYSAGLAVVLLDEPIVRWESACWEGSMEIGAVYAVDRGVAAFMDLETARALVRWTDTQREALIERFGEENVTVEVVDSTTGANVVISDCGGDGAYGVWIGRGAGGEIATVLTEFQVLDG